MKEELETLQQEALVKIKETDQLKDLQDIRVAYLGKKGSLTGVLRGMGKLSKEERPVIGEVANRVRETITAALDEKNNELNEKALEQQLANETIDVTLPLLEFNGEAVFYCSFWKKAVVSVRRSTPCNANLSLSIHDP